MKAQKDALQQAYLHWKFQPLANESGRTDFYCEYGLLSNSLMFRGYLFKRRAVFAGFIKREIHLFSSVNLILLILKIEAE